MHSGKVALKRKTNYTKRKECNVLESQCARGDERHHTSPSLHLMKHDKYIIPSRDWCLQESATKLLRRGCQLQLASYTPPVTKLLLPQKRDKKTNPPAPTVNQASPSRTPSLRLPLMGLEGCVPNLAAPKTEECGDRAWCQAVRL